MYRGVGHVLRATTACNFSFLIAPDATSPAALASLLFNPPDPQISGKTQCFATFLPFRAPVSSFFWLSRFLSSVLLLFSFLWLFLSLFFIYPYFRKCDFLNFFWLSDIISIFIMSTFNEGKFEGYEVATLRNSTPNVSRVQIPCVLSAKQQIYRHAVDCWWEKIRQLTGSFSH